MCRWRPFAHNPTGDASYGEGNATARDSRAIPTTAIVVQALSGNWLVEVIAAA